MNLIGIGKDIDSYITEDTHVLLGQHLRSFLQLFLHG